MSGEIWHRYIDSVEGGCIDNIHGVRIVRYTFNWISIRVHMVNKIRCFQLYNSFRCVFGGRMFKYNVFS